jgi:hypothetical protein
MAYVTNILFFFYFQVLFLSAYQNSDCLPSAILKALLKIDSNQACLVFRQKLVDFAKAKQVQFQAILPPNFFNIEIESYTSANTPSTFFHVVACQ